MTIDIITLFPEMFKGPFGDSIIKRAQEKNLVRINIHNLRKWTKDKHKTVDGRPYGGGPGMVLMVEPIYKAIKSVKSKTSGKSSSTRTILLSARGKRFTQQKAEKLAGFGHLILICGHYEDVDHRVSRYLVDEEISIGDYVLTGGEIPAMAVTDAVVRLIPEVLGKKEGLLDESHKTPGYVKYPQYTRPEIFMGHKVPEILLSGNHLKIKKWRGGKSKQV